MKMKKAIMEIMSRKIILRGKNTLVVKEEMVKRMVKRTIPVELSATQCENDISDDVPSVYDEI